MPQVLFRAIKAKQSDFRVFYNEIEKALDGVVKPDLLAYFNKVVKAWKNPPVFQARKKISLVDMQIYVYPTGPNAEIWKYVSFGTRPHIIRPKRAKALSFQWGGPGSYKPRTTTSGGYNGPGKVVGGKPVAFKHVNHPGNKARNFEKFIARWYKTRFKKVMDDAVRRGVRAAKQAAR